MKILMLADSMGRGGTERRLTELLKVITQMQEFDVELVVFSNRIQFEELFDLNLKIHIFERKAQKDFTPSIDLYRLCQKIKPDIIHSWGSMATIFAIPSKIRLKTTLINSIITDAPYDMSFFDKRLFRFKISIPFSDLILANSAAGLSAYQAPSNKSHVIYNGYDFNRLQNISTFDSIAAKWNIKNTQVVGMVGAFEPRKDYDMFIKTGISILSARSDVVFMAIGGGSLLDEMKNKVPDSIRSRFIFTGITRDVEDIIQLFDIGVLISNRAVHGEGISNAIMEYMAQKKPVVANDNGGNSEIIEHEKTGFIISDNQSNHLISHINYLLDNPEIAKEMGKEGYNRIKTTFHIDTMVDSFIQLYNGSANSGISRSHFIHQKQV